MTQFNQIIPNSQITSQVASTYQINEAIIEDEQSDLVFKALLSKLSDEELYRSYEVAAKDMDNLYEELSQDPDNIELSINYHAMEMKVDTIVEFMAILDDCGICVEDRVLNTNAVEVIHKALRGTIYQYIINGEMLQGIDQCGDFLTLSYDSHDIVIDSYSGSVIECRATTIFE